MDNPLLQWLSQFDIAINAFGVVIWLIGIFSTCFVWGLKRTRPSSDLKNAESAPAANGLWSMLLNAGSTQSSKLEERVSIRTVNIAVVTLLITNLAWVTIGLFSRETVYLTIVNGVSFLCALTTLVIQWNGRTALARWIFFILVAIYWTAIMVGVGPYRGVEYLFSFLLMLTVLLFSKRESSKRLIAVIAMLLTFAIAVYLQSIIPPMFDAPQTLVTIGYYVNAILLTLITCLVVNFYNNFAVKNFLELEEQESTTKERVKRLLPEYVSIDMLNDEESTIWPPIKATVMVATIDGYDTLINNKEDDGVEDMRDVFLAFDKLARKLGIEKVKTLHTTYMVATGLGEEREYRPDAVAAFALEARDCVRQFSQDEHQSLDFRAGIAAGLISIVGIEEARQSFEVWGETIEQAYSMCDKSSKDSISVHHRAHSKLCKQFELDRMDEDDQDSDFQLMSEKRET